MDLRKPRWDSSSFLLYLGLFTISGSLTAAYAYLADGYGSLAFVGWTVLMLAVLLVLAVVLRLRGPWLAAGVYAYLAVTAFGTFVGAVFEWWGWNSGGNGDNPFDGWHWAAWAVIVLVLAASLAALRRFKFPLFVLTICTLTWFLVTDVVSGGGNWAVVVTLLIGFLYFFVGLGVNRVYGFWVHVTSGLLIGFALLWWWHTTTLEWWLIAVAGAVYIAVGTMLRRSSWTVLGAAGLLAAATHFAIDWTTGDYTFFQGPTREWVPIVVAAVLGFLYVLLGLWATRRTVAE